MAKNFLPVYLNTDLKVISEEATLLLSNCEICPRKCRVNRLNNELGHCKTGKYALVSSFGPHFGEEPELVGYYGSGTIFFSYCNLNCVFCQNYDISQLGYGTVVEAKELADIMLKLQKMGCHNINLVSPTHVVPQFLQALAIAKGKGLHLPIVYNSGGYDSVTTLKLLSGVIDIYLPDAKYGSNEIGQKYSKVNDYWDINRLALKEMWREVGDLKTNESGIAERGLLIRHLVLPNQIDNSFIILKFIADELSTNTYINIMEQYRPCYQADKILELSRRIKASEYQEVLNFAKQLGFVRYKSTIALNLKSSLLL